MRSKLNKTLKYNRKQKQYKKTQKHGAGWMNTLQQSAEIFAKSGNIMDKINEFKNVFFINEKIKKIEKIINTIGNNQTLKEDFLNKLNDIIITSKSILKNMLLNVFNKLNSASTQKNITVQEFNNFLNETKKNIDNGINTLNPKFNNLKNLLINNIQNIDINIIKNELSDILNLRNNININQDYVKSKIDDTIKQIQNNLTSAINFGFTFIEQNSEFLVSMFNTTINNSYISNTLSSMTTQKSTNLGGKKSKKNRTQLKIKKSLRIK